MTLSPLAARMGSHFMPKFAEKIAKADIMTANEPETGKPDCVSDETATKQAAEWIKDPIQQGMINGMSVFPALGACWPETFWEAMLVDMNYYKVTIPFDQVTVPIHMIHGECDNDIPYSQAVQAKAGIPHAILITQPNGTHSC